MKEILLKEIEAIFKQDEKSDKELCIDLIKTIRKHEKSQYPVATVETFASLFDTKLNAIINGMEVESHFTTGFKSIDRIIGGFRYGELVLIAGRPGMGKTSLLMQLSLQVSKQMPVLYISFSISAKEYTNRVSASLTGIMARNDNDFSDTDKLQFQALADDIEQYKVHVSDNCHHSIAAIKELCIQQVKENRVRCIFIDNIQTINTTRYYQNRHQELEFIMQELAQLAKYLDICIILDSQLSRAVETRGGAKRPMMFDLSSSAALENIAHKILFVYRPEYYDIHEDENGNDTRGTAEIIISKNSSGPVGIANLAFISRIATFREREELEIMPIDKNFTFNNKRLKDLDETPF